MSAHTVFSDPQVARRDDARRSLRARESRTVFGRYDFAEHGKAMCLSKTKGFVKMMADRNRADPRCNASSVRKPRN